MKLTLTREEKIAAFRELTDGAPDYVATRVISNRTGDPVWYPVYSPLKDSSIELHMAGKMEIGTYPLIPSDGHMPVTKWVCADFDGKEGEDWKGDVQQALEYMLDAFEGAPIFLNISRSGQGAHLRLLFKDPVPAWMARRWMHLWLEEAGIISDPDDLKPGSDKHASFDRLIPPQDILSPYPTWDGKRRPGNLAGCPLHKRLMESTGGTAPIDPREAAAGNFEPDGRHWEHVMSALERREWGESELAAALEDWSGEEAVKPPKVHIDDSGKAHRSLPVVKGSNGEMQYMVDFCKFFRYMRRPDSQSYHLWVAMATHLHRFGEAGYDMWHQLSSIDPRYRARDADIKWKQTEEMNPIRCESLVRMGYRCPHLDDERCNGCKSPTYFANYTYAEIL